MGFVEGDGSFSLTKANLIWIFSIGKKGNLVLMKAIQDFFINLARDLNDEAQYVYITGSESMHYIFIKKSINSIFYTKKELDYKDWKTIFKIKELDLHYTKEGKYLIDFILGQMNNNRLSTYKLSQTKRTFSFIEIEFFFNRSSNYEIQKDGRIIIKSSSKYSWSRKSIKILLKDSQGLTFNSRASCAYFLGVSSFTVAKIIKMKTLYTLMEKNII